MHKKKRKQRLSCYSLSQSEALGIKTMNNTSQVLFYFFFSVPRVCGKVSKGGNHSVLFDVLKEKFHFSSFCWHSTFDVVASICNPIANMYCSGTVHVCYRCF